MFSGSFSPPGLSAGPETDCHAHEQVSGDNPSASLQDGEVQVTFPGISLNRPGLQALLRSNLLSSKKAAPITLTETLQKQNLPGRKKWK